MKGDDKEAIDAKTKALEEVFSPIAQKAYAEQAQAAGAQGGAQAEEPKKMMMLSMQILKMLKTTKIINLNKSTKCGLSTLFFLL